MADTSLSKQLARELTIDGTFQLPFNGRVSIAFDLPNDLLEKLSESRANNVKMFNSICATILLDAIRELNEEVL